MSIPIKLKVNEREYQVDVKPLWSLAYVLREKLNLLGTKTGCERGTCGSCTVLEDGWPIFSCLRLAVSAQGRSIITIEGVGSGKELHPLQRSFVENHGMQCGFCTPGMIIASKSLLDRNPNPTEHEIRNALSGHICRCGTYPAIVKSVMEAKKSLSQ